MGRQAEQHTELCKGDDVLLPGGGDTACAYTSRQHFDAAHLGGRNDVMMM